MASMSIAEKMDYALSTLGSLGIGREAALGALGSLAGESGRNLNTSAFNANDPNGGSIGIAQFNGSRREAMENFKSRWGDPTDFRHQMDFIAKELQTTERKTLEKLQQPGITRQKAADIWTRSYERPKDPDASLQKRQANADYYAAILSNPMNAVAAIESIAPTNKAATSPALGYVDPQVRVVDSASPTALMNNAAAPSDPITDIGRAVGAVASGIGGAAKALSVGDVNGAFLAMADPSSPAKQAAAQAEANAKAAGEKNKSGIEGFLSEDTSIAAVIGTIAGGVFGGGAGAVAGGLLGQGIGKAIDGLFGTTTPTADQTLASIDGGFARAIDGLFGATKQSGLDAFPSRPSGMERAATAEELARATQNQTGGNWQDSKQTRDAVEKGSAGLF